jgi:hypothetical protein
MTDLPRCSRCQSTTLVFRLHGDKGGPIVCLQCAEWIDRVWGRKQRRMLEDLGLTAARNNVRPGEVTQELIDDIIRLTHPDRHGPEQLALATRVTAALNALRPYVRSAPKPEPKPETPPGSWPAITARKDLLSGICQECIELPPSLLCDTCRAQWEDRREQERKAEAEKARRRRARKRAIKWQKGPPVLCRVCGGQLVKPRRTDVRYCSDRCRQRAHRVKS